MMNRKIKVFYDGGCKICSKEIKFYSGLDKNNKIEWINILTDNCKVLKNNISKKRNEIMKKLNKKGVGTSIYYPHPVPRMNYYKNKYRYNEKKFVNASIISDKSISFPIGPHLKQHQILEISKKINSVLKQYE